MDFNEFDHTFCEAEIYGREYVNAVSSLFITFIGANGLRKPTGYPAAGVYAAMIMNGVTSFFYHGWNTIGWGLMDRMSMVLIAISSISLFLRFLTGSRKMAILWHIIAVFYATCLLTAAGLHYETAFNILFGLFLVFLAGAVYLISKNAIRLKLPYRIVSYAERGILYIAASGFFWIITENLCFHVPWLKYLYGHVWWHIFVSYGGYLISLTPVYLSQRRDNAISYDEFGLPFLDPYLFRV